MGSEKGRLEMRESRQVETARFLKQPGRRANEITAKRLPGILSDRFKCDRKYRGRHLCKLYVKTYRTWTWRE